jgi:DNA-binding MarR family transcriptional regulator
MYLLLACHRLQKQLASSEGLSVDESHCLGQLFLHAPCCVKELCGMLGVTASRTSRLLHSLEARGYLLRSLGYQDKRKELLQLTEEGSVAAQRLLCSASNLVPELIGSLPENVAGYLLRSFKVDGPKVVQ